MRCDHPDLLSEVHFIVLSLPLPLGGWALGPGEARQAPSGICYMPPTLTFRTGQYIRFGRGWMRDQLFPDGSAWAKTRSPECPWGAPLSTCTPENGSLGTFHMAHGTGDWHSELDGSTNTLGGAEVSVAEG